MARVGRRRFLCAIGVLLTAPLAHAQSKALRRVGFLALPNGFATTHPNYFAWRELEEALARLGYREGATVAIVRRHAGGNATNLRKAAGELVQSKVEVIVAFGGQTIKAAREATQIVPIVAYSSTLVEEGFAKSYARPGGNVTGVSPSTTDVTQKQLEFLVSVVPGVRRVAWLRNLTNPMFSESFARKIDQSASNLGITAAPVDVTTAQALEAAIPEIARQGFDAVLIVSDIVYVQQRDRLAQLLLAHALPSAGHEQAMLDAGLLLNYGVDVTKGIGRMASQIDRILKGTNVAAIPIEMTEGVALGVNLRTARALGLTIPQSLMLRADRLIE